MQSKHVTTPKYTAFTSAMQGQYGVSEAYAEAAWFSLGFARESSASGKQLAARYCRRFGLSAVKA
jgi:hypothetical protein